MSDSLHYDMDDYMAGAPYGRVVRNGRVVRIETDGNGRTREILESTHEKCYGVTRSYLKQREEPPAYTQRQDHSDRVGRRERRLRQLVKWLRTHPDQDKWAIAEAFGVSSATAWHDLALLRQRGQAVSRHTGRDKQGRACNHTWRAATNGTKRAK